MGVRAPYAVSMRVPHGRSGLVAPREALGSTSASSAAAAATTTTTPAEVDTLERGRANIHETLVNQTRGRGMPAYVKALPGVGEHLAALADRPGARWMDAGAGVSGAAALGYLEYGPGSLVRPAYANGQTIEPTRTPPKALSVTLLDLDCRATPSARVQVLTGRYVEQIPQAELPKCHLITEVEGPFSYSTRPDLVLGRYVGALADDGVLLLGLGSTVNLSMPGRDSRVVTADGQVLSYLEWLQSIPGLQVTPRRYVSPDPDERYETLAAEIRRVPGATPQIPALTTLEFTGGGPPRMTLKAQTGDLSTAPEAQLAVEQAARATLATQALALDTAHVLDQFKSGPLDTHLPRAARRPGGWLHAGALRDEVRAELAAGKVELSARYPLATQLTGLITADPPIAFTNITTPEGLAGKTGLALITDQGLLGASPRPDLLLGQYIAALRDGGELMVAFGKKDGGLGQQTRVLTRRERNLGLAEWIKRIPGLDVQIHTRRGASAADDETYVRVRLTDRAAVDIPALQPLGALPSTGGARPLLLREDPSGPAPEATMGDVMNSVALRVWKALW